MTMLRTALLLSLALTLAGCRAKKAQAPYEATAEFQETQNRKAREGFASVVAEWKKMPPEKIRDSKAVFDKLPALQHRSFAGVPVAKNPLDLWMIQQIIHETRPDLIIETGTGTGGSALFYASVLSGADMRGRILTVDSQSGSIPAETRALWKDRVERITGNSTDPAIVKRIAERAKDHSVMVILGSARAADELKAYGPLVTKGNYLIVENARAAVDRFLASEDGPEFERDSSREMYLITFNPGGWLKRK